MWVHDVILKLINANSAQLWQIFAMELAPSLTFSARNQSARKPNMILRH